MNTRAVSSLALLLPLLAGAAAGWAQVTTTTTTTTTTVQPAGHPVTLPANIVMPQTHRVPRAWASVGISAVAADITINDQVATTTLEIAVHNPGGAPQEAELLLPVPDGVTIRSLQYDGTGPEPTAKLLPRDEARRIYNSIVHASRDPALLEFAGLNLIRSSAFPVPAGATQKIRITFEQLLASDAGRLDYILPKAESLATGAGVPWTIKATFKSSRPISTVYSASHDLVTERKGAGEFVVTVPASSASGPGSFRLSALVPQDASAASGTLYAYPDQSIDGGKGGYFMFVAALPAQRPAEAKPVPREVTVVIDRSGSMRGEKFQQAQKAAANILAGLDAGEKFNIIDYSDNIESFSKDPVVIDDASRAKAAEYIGKLQPDGGTNLHDALLTALNAPAAPNMMSLVLFLTDGLPTVGERAEATIRDHAASANKAGRRIFTFGVGLDVNTPLLSGLARGAKGAPTFVLPSEDVEQKVSQVYRRLKGPTLADAKLAAYDAEGKVSTRAIRDLQPGTLDDVFDGDQIVILGQYTGESDALRLKVEGQYFGAPRTFEFTMKLDGAAAKNGYVPRLWATRKIGRLVEELRQLGADPATSSGTDPRSKELLEQITQLSLRWGVMTPYTSFLATEALALGEHAPALDLQVGEHYRRVSAARGGAGGVTQDNDAAGKLASVNVQKSNTTYSVAPSPPPAATSGPNGPQGPVDARYAGGGGGGQTPFSYRGPTKEGEAGGQVVYNAVQNINAQTYYLHAGRWIDGRVLEKESEKPEVEVTIGTDAFEKIADALIDEGQQGVLSLEGDILVLVSGKRTLIHPAPATAPAPTPTPDKK